MLCNLRHGDVLVPCVVRLLSMSVFVFVIVRVEGWDNTRVKAKEIMRGLFLIGLPPSPSQQETSIRENMCEMCSFVFQEKSGSLPGQSYSSSKNASRSDHSPVFGEYSYVKAFELMTFVNVCVCSGLVLHLLCATRQAGRQARWWVRREEGGFLKVAKQGLLNKATAGSALGERLCITSWATWRRCPVIRTG